MIYYFCPDLQIKSSGLRLLYRHVQILSQHGIPAAILHQNQGFSVEDMPTVPIRYLNVPGGTISQGDTVVIPEGFPNLMEILKPHPIRRLAIALNWSYVYASMPEQNDWRSFGIERVITNSDFIAQMITWSMGLSTHVFKWGIRDELYTFDESLKKPYVVFIQRKKEQMAEFQRLLVSRNPEFLKSIQWRGLHSLSEADYASEIRQASLFINLSHAEGMPCAMLEAMRSGTLVAGFNSVGGQAELTGQGDRQNCILAENLDYPTLAYRIEPLLIDILKGDLTPWKGIRQNALEFSSTYTRESETESVTKMWQVLLAD